MTTSFFNLELLHVFFGRTPSKFFPAINFTFYSFNGDALLEKRLGMGRISTASLKVVTEEDENFCAVFCNRKTAKKFNLKNFQP